jgi:hypothetical protein
MGERMNTVLLSAGVACVIAAVVGGGLKAFHIEVPVVSSLRRQALLFVVGLGFLASAWVLRDQPSGPDEATVAYRQLAVATCGRIAKIHTADMPFDVIDLSANGIRFHKGPLVRELRRRQSAEQAEFAALWAHSTPAGLRSREELANRVTGEWLSRVDEQIQTLKATAHNPVSQADGEVLDKSGDAALRARVNDAMTALAGLDCPVAGTG